MNLQITSCAFRRNNGFFALNFHFPSHNFHAIEAGQF